MSQETFNRVVEMLASETEAPLLPVSELLYDTTRPVTLSRMVQS